MSIKVGILTTQRHVNREIDKTIDYERIDRLVEKERARAINFIEGWKELV